MHPHHNSHRRQTRTSAVVAAVALALTGCGSGLSAHPAPPTTPTVATSATTAATPATSTAPAPAPTQTAPVRQGTTFHIALSGAAASRHSRAPSGLATIRFLTSQGEVCWTFFKLTGVHPTQAYIGGVTISGSPSGIRAPLPTTPEYLFGPHYATRGCIRLIASAIGELLSSPTGDNDIGIASGKHLNVIWGLL